MIADWDTNRLFVSDLLEKSEPDLFSWLQSLSGLALESVPGTSDIWCRDYMPVQLDDCRFCQFVYSPDYLHGYESLITPPEKCRLPFMQDVCQEPIVLDGGNVVASRTTVILTDKLYRENRKIKKAVLQRRLEQIFQTKCIVIPSQSGDDVGHSDGVVRFVSEGLVFMNDYSATDPAYGAKLRTLLERNGLMVETLPMFEEDASRRQDDLPSAVGLYINYLRVGDVVVVPGYGRPEDAAALEKVRQVMPNASVYQVPCRRLAEKGGVLNCISWTIKTTSLKTSEV